MGKDDASLQDSKVPKCGLKSGAGDRAGSGLATTDDGMIGHLVVTMTLPTYYSIGGEERALTVAVSSAPLVSVTNQLMQADCRALKIGTGTCWSLFSLTVFCLYTCSTKEDVEALLFCVQLFQHGLFLRC